MQAAAPAPDRRGFAGRVIVSFESRRAAEIGELIRRHGGVAIVAPSMREVALEANTHALSYLQQLEAGAIDITVFLTGVGLRALLAALPDAAARDRLVAALPRQTVVARGPKPVAVLRELGLRPDVVAPEPNTWRELLAALDAHGPLAGRTIAVQEYGIANDELLAGLTARGAKVCQVPVYRWALPEDLQPLREAIERICTGGVAAALFTSATQVHHVFQVAGVRAADVAAGLRRLVVASVGPICSEALVAHGVGVRFEPTHPKMGPLVGELARAFESGTVTPEEV